MIITVIYEHVKMRTFAKFKSHLRANFTLHILSIRNNYCNKLFMYKVDNIADYFLSSISEDKGDTISPLKLQKLVYYAQAWHYTLFDSPLFNERIEAWVNGPVVPSLYTRFAGVTKHSAINISSLNIEDFDFDARTLKLLNEVSQIYGEKSGSYLENLTHSEQPWIKARGITPPYAISKNEITLESMKEFYSTFKHEA